MKRLIVNADDFGHAAGVNRGILDAHHKGIVTSTTVMINYPAAPAGLEQALNTAPDLGIGLHFTLTSGRSVLPPEKIPSLVWKDGRFFVLKEWGTQFEKVDPDDVRREMIAQMERYISLTGKPPDHLDSHHHFTYLLPSAFEVMLDLAEQYHLPIRKGPFNFSPDEVAPVHAFPELTPDVAERAYERLHAIYTNRTEPNWPAQFKFNFYDHHATLGDLLLILTNLEPDSLTEIMCHPGYVDDDLGSIYGSKREDEIAHLTHAATRECVVAEGITLVTYGELIRYEQTA
jgi:predicted glycoside hydrolase/deacetylase ChbG (UPF0249 family)